MKVLKNRSVFLLAFLLPVVGCIVLFALNGISPFGSEKTVCFTDANGQYISFFAYYRDLIIGNSSPLFTFAKMIGGNAVGLISYYLLSPFNLLLLLFPTSQMPVALAVLGIFKIGSSGLTSALFFHRHSGNDINTLFLSTAYALMSYNLIYLPNIMWLDGVVMLPLIALGIDHIFDKQSGILYVVVLSSAILSNYYIGFILCIASVLYFLWRVCTFITPVHNTVKIAGRYALCSLLGGFLCMGILLPTLESLEGTNKGTLNFDQLIGLQTQLSFRTLLSHLLIPSTTMADINTMLPNVFVGFLPLAFCAVFLLTPRIPWRKKLTASVIVLIFLGSFYFSTPYYIWHIFSDPACFEYRFAFVFSFFILLLTGEFLQIIKLKTWGMLALTALNCICCLWYGNANYKETSFPTNHFTAFYNETAPIIEKIKNSERKNNQFYRIEKDYRYNLNDALTFGYNGLAHYSSGEVLATHKAIRSAGYTAIEQYGYYGTGSTLASDSMFGIKYLLYKNTHRTGLLPLGTENNISVYQNPYAWPLAIKASATVTQLDISQIRHGLLPQILLNTAWNTDYSPISLITDSVLQTENITQYEREDGLLCYEVIDAAQPGKLHYSFFAPQSSNFYLFLPLDCQGTVSQVSCNETMITGYPNAFDHGVKYIGQMKQGEKNTLTLTISSGFTDDGMMLLYDDLPQLDAIQNQMQTDAYPEQQFTSDSFLITGTMDDTEGLLLMIPFTKGWQIYVNGQKVTAESVIENFIYISVPAGEFTMEGHFVPPGLITGCCLSALALIISVLYLWPKKKR